ncbi:MAG: hypothetical protein WEB03_01690 [Nitriliruptor sp.]|uniref:hypothetical protein n=1 Tax=Nitriliruptor sp. TaxID=2448056 RepID=UPI00349FD261
MSELLVRDVTRAGRELGRASLTDLPASATIGELLSRRIHDEVATYNGSPGPVFVGLVQPADSIRHSDGFRMRSARQLDADAAVLAAREAVAAGMLSFRLGDEVTSDLDRVVDIDGLDELLVVLERPVVAEL